jgi:phosphate starvation-inducible PhoH-like protein
MINTNNMVDNTIEFDDVSIYKRICGFGDRNIKIIENYLDVNIIPRGNLLIIDASEKNTKSAVSLLNLMADYLHMNGNGYELNEVDIKYLAKTIASGKNIDAGTIKKLKITIPETGKAVLPRTINQAEYISTIHKKAVTLSYGPAGTGKTFLAVAVALHYLNSGQMKRIVLTRPAVEAGENLGFLPGDLIQKINPYLRPLYDALFDLMPYERIPKLIDSGNIEIAPLAYMRGRTLNDAFIILDEAQNTTKSQMKMILTRIGNNSKIVISGDITQIDLEKPKNSGLLNAIKILKDIDEIGFIQFSKEDICRHPIVEKIVTAYERQEKNDKQD